MKYSQFNTLIPFNGNYLFYNSFTNKFLYLNPLLKDLIVASQNENNIHELKNIHIDFYNSMVELGFLVENNTDEIKKVKDLIYTIDYNDDEYYLIINPTMNCNFSCWYCYENHEKQSHLSETTLQNIKLFISNLLEKKKDLKKFTIQFFGGEPLLYYKKAVLPLLKYLNNEVRKDNIILSINFTTNGYLINDDMIKDFIRYNVNAFQITFDGNKEKHNLVRYVSKNKGSYDKIVENVKKLVQNNFGVTFRVNYTEENLIDLDSILDSFTDLSLNERAKIMLSMNKVWEETNDNLGTQVIAFKEKAEKFGFKLPDSLLSDRVRYSCYADKYNQATINYNGDVFKCNARDFDTNNREGILNEEGSIIWNKRRDKRMSEKIIFNKSCSECNILPICGGGCSQQHIEYEGIDYCVNNYDENEKNAIIIAMFQSKEIENIENV